MIELRCSRDLALRLGAIPPLNVAHHRALAEHQGMILVRDRETGWAMFWPVVPVDQGTTVRGVINRLLGKSS